MPSSGNGDSRCCILSFDEALRPLAYNLFPDGFIDGLSHTYSSTFAGTKTCAKTIATGPTKNTIASIWNPGSRAVVPEKQSLSTLKDLERRGNYVGFLSLEQDAMVLVACATLTAGIDPSLLSMKSRKSPVQLSPSVRLGKLRDGSSRYFRELLRMTFPRARHPVSKYTVLKLLSHCREYKDIPATRSGNGMLHQAMTMEKDETSMKNASILQFLSLAIQSGALSEDARQCLSSMYPLLFQLALDKSLCADAVRLLYSLTRSCHVRVYRAQKLRQTLDRSKTGDGKEKTFAPLALLLQLYGTLDPHGCGPFSLRRSRDDNKTAFANWRDPSRWLSFPDQLWQRNFCRVWYKYGTKNEAGHAQRTHPTMEERHDPKVPSKRPRSSFAPGTKVGSFVVSWERAHYCSSEFGLHKNKLQAWDVLKDTALSHLHFFSAKEQPGSEFHHDDETTAAGQTYLSDVARMEVCLPLLLQQKWYQAPYVADPKNSHGCTRLDCNDDRGDASEGGSVTCHDGISSMDEEEGGESNFEEQASILRTTDEGRLQEGSPSLLLRPIFLQAKFDKLGRLGRPAYRRRLLEAIASLATQTDWIVPQAESLLANEFYPYWDGTEELGILLCFEILPCPSVATEFSEMKACILDPLERFILFGPPKVQFALVSAVLGSLLGRVSTQCGAFARQLRETGAGLHQGCAKKLRSPRRAAIARLRLLKDLVAWTDNLLQSAVLRDVDGPSELLSGAIIDFFYAVCHEVSKHCNLLILPSTSLVCQLLLSRSAFSIDRVCKLLVDYKEVFLKLKYYQDRCGAADVLDVEGLDR